MCTLTWWREDDRYALFFNRDELKTRLPARPPEIRERNGVRFIAPADGDHGGTWLLGNEFGVSVALLNYYDAGSGGRSLRDNPVSRGELVLSLGGAPSLDAVAAMLEETPLVNYRAFHLFALAPRDSPRLWTWSGGPGAVLRVDERPEPPVTTSSYRTEEVCARRRERFLEAIESAGRRSLPDRLELFHQGIDSENGAFSVRMRRPDAQTVSFSRIDVDGDKIRFTYRRESVDSLEVNEATRVILPLANP